jgi:hypothetical protein
MFWNDPHLYGVKDVPPVQTPFVGQNLFPGQIPWQTPFAGQNLPWQSVPRFLPPTYYGFTPQYIPPMAFPYMPPALFNPYMQPFNMNLPLYNFYRPFTY